MIWGVVVVGALGCYLLKYAGLAAPAALMGHPAVRRAVDLLPAALLGALVVVQALTHGDRWVLDSRAAGLAAAAVALWARAPFLLVLAVAGATAALVSSL